MYYGRLIMAKGRMTPQQLLIAQRKKARFFAIQALYRWHMNHDDITVICQEFHTDKHFFKADAQYFNELTTKVSEQAASLDKQIKPAVTDRSFNEINPIEKAILRLCAYELTQRPDIPYKVAIHEAIALAKTFGASESHKFINAVVDRLAQTARHIEVEHNRSKPA